jgi:hypothetical protein
MNRARYRHAVRTLDTACRQFRVPLATAVGDKATEISLRDFFRAIPGNRLKDRQIVDYLTEVVGSVPPQELIDRVRMAPRGPRLTEEAVIEIEKRQNYRCAICGVVLTRSSNPHVDHVIPVALGGESELANYQLLCEKCNNGKGDYAHWIMAMPFFLIVLRHPGDLSRLHPGQQNAKPLGGVPRGIRCGTPFACPSRHRGFATPSASGVAS